MSVFKSPIQKKFTDDAPPKFTGTGNEKWIWLHGQSNATGKDDLSPPSNPANSYIYDIVSNTTQALQLDINSAQNFKTPSDNLRYGIELQLMNSLSVHYNANMYMFKNGYPGAFLADDGGPDSWAITLNTNAANSLYLQSIGLLQLAKRSLPLRNKTELDWVIWIQGEADAGTIAYYTAYQTNLTNYINAWRAVPGCTTAKWILVSLSNQQTAVNSTGMAAVNTAMSNIAGLLTNVFYISQNSSVEADGLHYDPAGRSAIASLVYNVIINN